MTVPLLESPMRRTPFLLALAAAAFVSTSPAQAQSARALEDFRCALVGIIASGGEEDDDDGEDTSALLAMYFLGRLDVRDPNFDGKRHLQREFTKLLDLDKDDLEKTTRGCYDVYQKSQDRLDEWAED